MALFKKGKLHVPHRKNTALKEAVKMTPPASVTIPLSQHIGAPATPVVKLGDKVFVGRVNAVGSRAVCTPRRRVERSCDGASRFGGGCRFLQV